MPLYVYRCVGCGYKFEILQTHKDEPIKICPKCGKEVKRIIVSTSFRMN